MMYEQFYRKDSSFPFSTRDTTFFVVHVSPSATNQTCSSSNQFNLESCLNLNTQIKQWTEYPSNQKQNLQGLSRKNVSI
jgi:hypothetical protein